MKGISQVMLTIYQYKMQFNQLVVQYIITYICWHNAIDTVNSMIQNGAVTEWNGTLNYNRLNF